MKVKIDGEEIECTVEEYLQLKGKEKKVAQRRETERENEYEEHERLENVPEQTEFKRYKFNDKEIINLSHLELDLIAKKLNVSYSSLWKHIYKNYGGIYKLRKKFGIQKTRVVKNSTLMNRPDRIHALLSNPKINKRQMRNSFVASRSNWLMKQYNWSREKCWQQAASDWNNHKAGLGKVHEAGVKETFHQTQRDVKNIDVEEINFPEIEPIAHENQKDVERLVANSLKTNGRIRFNDVTHLKLKRSENAWGQSTWQMFCADFMTKSPRISKCFFVANKWKFDLVSKELVYG